MLTNHPWGLAAFSGGKFHRKCSRWLSLIWVWKLLIKNYICISQGQWVKCNNAQWVATRVNVDSYTYKCGVIHDDGWGIGCCIVLHHLSFSRTEHKDLLIWKYKINYIKFYSMSHKNWLNFLDDLMQNRHNSSALATRDLYECHSLNWFH